MKNRTVIGVICIVLAVAVTFVVSPLVNKISEKKTEVVRFVADAEHGTKITEEDVELVAISNKALPEKAIKSLESVIGKYTTADVFKGDIVTESKITENSNTADDIMLSLKGDKVAMSVTINTFAGGLSGKLQNGDIITFYVTDKEGETKTPPELKYVKVITTTTSGGIDENEVVENEDGSFELPTTVTVLVTVKQASILANHEENAKLHVALVYRGDEAKADKFIKTQDDFLKKASDNNG